VVVQVVDALSSLLHLNKKKKKTYNKSVQIIIINIPRARGTCVSSPALILMCLVPCFCPRCGGGEGEEVMEKNSVTVMCDSV
jgi:hypothetical protein